MEFSCIIKKYAEDILKKFNMSNCNHATTHMETNIKLNKESEDELVDIILYKQIIDSLRYIQNTRPNICHNVRLVNRFMEGPRRPRFILSYIRGSTNHGIFFPHQQNTTVEAKGKDILTPRVSYYNVLHILTINSFSIHG